MRHVHTVCKQAPSLFPPFPVMQPLHPFFYFFHFHPCQPSFPFPDATKVKQEQCSVSPHLSCRNKPPTQLCNAKKVCMKQGRRDTEAWGGWMQNEEHASSSCILHTQHNRYRHTNHPAIPQQQGNHHSTQMDTDNLSKRAVQMPQNQWVKQKKEGKNRALQRKEYLALPSGVRDLEKRKQTQRKRTEREDEHRGTPILQLYCHYACFAWWQTMTITLKAKLSQVHLKAFSCKRQINMEWQHMQILCCLLWNSRYKWQNILISLSLTLNQ